MMSRGYSRQGRDSRWNTFALLARSAYRLGNSPDGVDTYNGFRLVRR